MQPIIVYLDTSDFSAMYSARVDEPIYQIRTELLNLAKSGCAIFGLSYVHFFEFLQDACADYQHDRLDRIRFLEILCDGWSFPFYEDLLDTSQIRRSPYWIPSEALKRFDIEPFIRDLQTRVLNDARLYPHLFPNRQSRRKLKSRAAFVEWVARHPTALAENIALEDDVYGSAMSSGIMRKYVLGSVSRDAANLRSTGGTEPPCGLSLVLSR